MAGIVIAAGVAAAFAANSSTPSEEEKVKQMLDRIATPTIPTAYALGSPEAPITLIEFGDYLCTFCHRFHEETKNQLVANYVGTGKVRFLLRTFR
jgi:protein-disulfide isomerase